MKKKLSSRKLWVATITALLLWVSGLAGMELSSEMIAGIAGVASSYVLGESVIDAARSNRKGE